MDTTTSARTATDRDIQRSVIEELEWTPGVEPTHIGVAVEEGVVTLSGEVATAAARFAVKRAVQALAGVRAVADELQVHGVTRPPSDPEIAAAAAAALERTSSLPPKAVQPSVHDGVVTLTGTVPWNYLRRTAVRAVAGLTGVREVHDWIALSPRPSAATTGDRIRDALVRNAAVDAAAIQVGVDGTAVTLDGTVRSFAEKAEAVRAAWASPYVTGVEDRIRVAAP